MKRITKLLVLNHIILHTELNLKDWPEHQSAIG